MLTEDFDDFLQSRTCQGHFLPIHHSFVTESFDVSTPSNNSVVKWSRINGQRNFSPWKQIRHGFTNCGSRHPLQSRKSCNTKLNSGNSVTTEFRMLSYLSIYKKKLKTKLLVHDNLKNLAPHNEWRTQPNSSDRGHLVCELSHSREANVCADNSRHSHNITQHNIMIS